MLLASGEIESLGDGLPFILNNLSIYDDDLGLVVDRSGEIPLDKAVL